MRQRLESFKALCVMYRDWVEKPSQADKTSLLRSISDQTSFQLPTVREILKRLDPALAEQVKRAEDVHGATDSLRAIQQGLGILSDMDQWPTNLAPDAPSLTADQFHPHVWAPAAALWETGQYRVAVGQAAVSLSAHIAKKANSSLSERELVAQVFSPSEPSANQLRLHLPGNKASRTWRSRQDGLHLMAQGAFAGIRNVAAHTESEWTEQVALEHLAVLSVLARWVDETETVAGR